MNNRKIVILIIILAVILGIFALSKFDKSNTSNTPLTNTKDDPGQTEWVTYSDKKRNFSFVYPKDDFIEPSSDTRFLRVQNYNPQEFTRSLAGKYWIEFFDFAADNGSSTCPQYFETYDTFNQNGFVVYKGDTKVDELSGVGGLQGLCINRGEYDLYAQGQDETGKNILTQIFDSIQFSE